jgi:hypothetical protein
MTLDDSVRAMRLRVIHRAQALGSVTASCREAGIFRTVFCQALTLAGFELAKERRAGASRGAEADGHEGRRGGIQQRVDPLLPPARERQSRSPRTAEPRGTGHHVQGVEVVLQEVPSHR